MCIQMCVTNPKALIAFDYTLFILSIAYKIEVGKEEQYSFIYIYKKYSAVCYQDQFIYGTVMT